MIETRDALMAEMLKKWKHNAQHFDDYRGILMCIRELEDVLTKTADPLPQDVQQLVQRATSEIVQMQGKPFLHVGDTVRLVTDLLTVVKALAITQPVAASPQTTTVAAGKK